LFFFGTSEACVGRTQPDWNDYEYSEFSSVVIGQVVSSKFSDQSSHFENGQSQTPEHILQIKITSKIKGEFTGVIEIKSGGCFVPLPKLGAKGLFFIYKNSNRAIPIYEGEGEIATDWFEHVKAS
jgi:hypothetical protein